MRALVWVSLAFGLLTVGEDPKADRARKELEKLQGTWTMTKIERDGVDLTGQFGMAEVVFEGASFHTPGIRAEFKLDPSQNPKAIDLSYKEGPAAGQTIKAIYKQDGDALTICRASGEGAERPATFEAPGGSGRMLFVFQRKPANP